ncbi:MULTISPECIES: hypothetical protein [unclassified Kitasatospora]|uniref:hypothetical protein n=1 Tax=unclassified Kitasatospora TaxID=2633591 RepID=UPI0037F3390F
MRAPRLASVAVTAADVTGEGEAGAIGIRVVGTDGDLGGEKDLLALFGRARPARVRGGWRRQVAERVAW